VIAIRIYWSLSKTARKRAPNFEGLAATGCDPPNF
jgi:hypothetical protein